MGYVYKITNTINGKAYIGISVYDPIKGRIKEHLSGSPRGNRLIGRALKKYGKDAFTYEILEANVFDEFLPDLEVAYIANYNTVAPHGYNLDSGGSHAIPSESTRRRMSENRKGEKNPNFGKTHSEETKRKMSESWKFRKGKPHTAETRRRMSENRKGEKNPNFGKTFPESTRRKMSESRRGEKNPNFGKTLPESTRRKISKKMRGKNKGTKNHFFGKTHSEEVKRKLSEVNRLPEYTSVHKFFLSLPPDMPLDEKRKLLYTKFSGVKKKTIWSWVCKWTSSSD